MRLIAVLPYYFLWHYSEGTKSVVSITRNFLWFLWHFFAIGILLKTLFTPWQRISERTRHRLDIGEFFEVHMINGIMRAVGCIVRMTVISVGLALLAVTIAGGAAVFVVWLAMPALIIALAVAGVVLVGKSI